MTVQTIARYFAKCGFTEQASNDIEDDPFSDLVAAVDKLRDKDPSQVPDDVTPEAIVSVDDAAMVTQSYASEQEIVDEIVRGENIERIERSLSRRRKTTRRKRKPSAADFRTAMDTIFNFSMFYDDADFQS